MSDPRVELIIDGPVARFTLRRPEKLNAIDEEMTDALLQACRVVERSDARLAILTGRAEGLFAQVAISRPGAISMRICFRAAGCATGTAPSTRWHASRYH